MGSRNISLITKESFTTEETTLETAPIAATEEATLETGPIVATEEAALEIEESFTTEEAVLYSEQTVATGEMVSNTKLKNFVRWIVEKGSLAYFEIINGQVNINIHNYNGETVLHKLVELNDLDAIGLILQDGKQYDEAITLFGEVKPSNLKLYKIHINAVSYRGTALDLAESRGNKEIIELLRRHSAKRFAEIHKVVDDSKLDDYVSDFRFRPWESYFPGLGCRENFNIYNVEGETILHKLVKFKDFNTIQIILQEGKLYELGAEANRPDNRITDDYYDFYKIDINAVSHDGTALDLAVSLENEEIIALLRRHGAKTFAEIHEVVNDELLQKYADNILYTPYAEYSRIIKKHENINVYNAHGETILHKLAMLNYSEAIQLLLQEGKLYESICKNYSSDNPTIPSYFNFFKVDINAVSYRGTALDLAILKGDDRVIRILRRHGAKTLTQLYKVVDDTVLENFTDFIERNSDNACYTIIARGSNINAYNDRGETVLHKLVMSGSLDAIKSILQTDELYDTMIEIHGANVNARAYFKVDVNAISDWGTALDLAIFFERTEIAELLLIHGAKKETELYNSNTHVARIVRRRRRDEYEETKDAGKSV